MTHTIILENQTITITVLDANAESAELEVTSDTYTTGYGDVREAINLWLDDQGNTWTVEDDMGRVGVGITADGRGAGHAALFHAGISRHNSASRGSGAARIERTTPQARLQPPPPPRRKLSATQRGCPGLFLRLWQ